MSDPAERTVIRWRSPEERRAVQSAAEEAGLPESTWLRRVALAAAGREDLLPEPECSVAARRLRRGS